MTDPINTIPNQPQTNPQTTSSANSNYPEPPLIINSPSNPKFSKSKLIAVGIVSLFFLVSIPLALFLSQNRQDIRQRAAGGCREGWYETNRYGQCCGCHLAKEVIVCHSDIYGDEYIESGCVADQYNAQTCTTDCTSGQCPAGNGGQSGETCSNQNKCDLAGGCNPACCASDNDCSGQTCSIPNNYCRGGSSCAPTGGISCSADRNGVSVTNNSGSAKNLNIEWFAATCGGDSGFCGGSPQTISKTLAAGENWNAGIYGQYCGSWQSDVDVSGDATCHADSSGKDNSDCSTPVSPTPTPIPPIATYDCRCTDTKIYRAGTLIEPTQVRLNDTLTFAGYGWIDAAEGTDNIDAMRITIKRNGTVVNTTTQQVIVARDSSQDSGTKRYFKGVSREFVVDQAGNYTVEVLVHTTKKEWLGSGIRRP